MTTLAEFIQQRAQAEGVDPRVALSLILQESGGDPSAVGDRGQAVGLGQLHPKAAIEGGISPSQRGQVPANVAATLSYLKQQLDRSGGDYNKALSFYNQGPGRFNQAGIGYGNPIIQAANKMQMPQQGLSLDDIAGKVLEGQPEPPAQGGQSLDDIAAELLGGLPPERDWGGAIPIDPNAGSAPESPLEGDGRLTRDLLGMLEMGGAMGAIPARGVGVALNALRTGIKARKHWSNYQSRSARGQFTKGEAPKMETVNPADVQPSTTSPKGDIPGWAPWLATFLGHPHVGAGLRIANALGKKPPSQ